MNLWNKYKLHRKLQKTRYLKFKCNSIYWTKIDIETISPTKNCIKYGSCRLGYQFYKFCPLITILYKTGGIFIERRFYFEKERYETAQEAQDNARIKFAGLIQQIQDYFELKKKYDKS